MPQAGVINQDVLAKHEQDTLHAQTMLAQIFASQDSEETPRAIPQPESSSKPVHTSKPTMLTGLRAVMNNYSNNSSAKKNGHMKNLPEVV